jgi:adenylate cyclase
VSTPLSFGEWLRQRRRALGLTHAALAEAVHCSVSALRKIEQDERRPSHPLAERLAGRLQITPAQLPQFLEIARAERHADALARIDAPALAPLPSPGPLHRLFVPFDASMPSIAVLPFANLSDDAANELFADGLAEELLNVLARIPGLRVVSRTSAFSFKGKALDVPTIARRLNVAAILEGSVRKSGQRVRVTAQLVQTRSDSHLWSQAYDRDLQDIFAVQDDIARCVVTELRGAFLGPSAGEADETRVERLVVAANRGRTDDARAHQLYLQGRFLIDRHVSEDTATGISYCRQALAIDPHYALAWAGLSRAYSNQASWGWAPLAEANERSREAANRALALEPDLPEAHAELGWVRMTFDWDWRGAEQSYRRALAGGSGHCSIAVGASLLADNLGRNVEAVALARRAVQVDPLSYLAQGNLALRCFNAGLLDEACDAVETALALHPHGTLLHWVLGTIRLEQARLEEALQAFEQEGVASLRVQGVAMVHGAAGRPAQAQTALDELIRIGADDSAFQIAEAFAYRGQADPAFEWLERAREQRDPGVSQIQSGPLLRKLHGDARWRPFLETLGFTEFPDAAQRVAH